MINNDKSYTSGQWLLASQTLSPQMFSVLHTVRHYFLYLAFCSRRLDKEDVGCMLDGSHLKGI